jgi:hypothetical protein
MTKKGGIAGSGLMLPGEIGQVMVAREAPSSSMSNKAYATGGAAAFSSELARPALATANWTGWSFTA